MKNLFFILTCLVSVLFYACGGSGDKEDVILKFEGNGVYGSYESFSDTIIINSNVNDYDVKRGSDYDRWIDYRLRRDSLFIFVDKNYSTLEREGSIVIRCYYPNIIDTLFVFQMGNPNTSGGSSSGGIDAGQTQPSSRRCAAITQKGTRCKRTASSGSIYCWQHKR